MNAANLIRVEKLFRKPLARFVPPPLVVKFYSEGRIKFLKHFETTRRDSFQPPASFARKCWGIDFRFPLFNAAGLFKNGDGYETVLEEGAGAYLAGTTTANARVGNSKHGVRLAFTPYPASRCASNWLGLPNEGDEIVAKRVAGFRRVPGFPIGASLMGSSDYQGEERLTMLLRGLKLYEEAGVDFIELNESCPNTEEGKPEESELRNRLERIRREFLAGRRTNRPLPVIVKFSNDTEPQQVPALIEMLLSLDYDGVNFGNTSTAYAKHRTQIADPEKKLYDYFTSTFGGGVSGEAVKQSSLSLVTAASAALKTLNPAREFHIIRTGGVGSAQDVKQSFAAGASLVQWYSGYFDHMADHGPKVYRAIAADLI